MEGTGVVPGAENSITDPQASAAASPSPAPPTPSAPPAPSAPSAPAAPAASPTAAPNVVQPVRRGGLAGIIDEFRDAVAGTHGPGQVFTDEEGQQYIKHPDLTGKQKWLKILGTAVRGAAAGAQVGQGPGGKFRAAAAGIESSDKSNENERKNESDLRSEVRQNNMDKFNSIKLKHDLVAQEFQMQRLKIKATQEDVAYAQGQMDREQGLIQKGLGADLGIYKDEADLANVQKKHPEFWKDTYAGSHGRTVAVPEIDPETGARTGVHLFLHMPGVNSTLEPEGTTIKVPVPPAKAGDPWTLKDVTPTEPMTVAQHFAYDAAAYNKIHEDEVGRAELEVKRQQAAKDKAEASQSPSKIELNKAEANRANAEADKDRSANEEPDAALVQDIKSGRVAPERISYLLARPNGQKLLAAVAAGGDVDTSRLASYPALYHDFSSGKTSQQLQNLNTAFKTVNDLRKLNTYSSRLPTGDARTAWDNKLTTASAEIANGLAKPGATATKDEIDKVRASLNTTFSRDSALDKQMESLMEQYDSIRDKWHSGSPSDSYEAKMPDIGGESRRLLYKHDPNKYAPIWGVPYYDKPEKDGGRLLGFSKDGGKTYTK